MSPDEHVDSDPVLTSETTLFVRRKGINWTEEMCREAADSYEQQCRETGEIPTGQGYQTWQRGREGMPEFTTLLRFFDAQDWTRYRCIIAIRDFEAYCQQTGDPPSTNRYDTWRKEHKAPHRDTITKYLGVWESARTIARRDFDTSEEPRLPPLPTSDE